MKQLLLLCLSICFCPGFVFGQTCAPTNTSVDNNSLDPLYFCNRCPNSYPGGSLTGNLFVSDGKNSQITVTVPQGCNEFSTLTLGAMNVTLGVNDRLVLNPNIIANPEAINFSITAVPNPNPGGGITEFFYRGVKYSTATGTPTIAQGQEKVRADAEAALPVSLLYWNATPQSQGVELTWGTAQEEDNDYFAVEHSTDGRQFSPLTRLAGAGTRTTPLTYSYRHANPSPGTNYYRLMQYDLDGTATAFPVVSADYTAGDAASGLYPNPAAPGQTIRFPAPAEATVVDLYHLDGRLIQRVTAARARESGLTLPATIKPGLYLLRAASFSERLLIN